MDEPEDDDGMTVAAVAAESGGPPTAKKKAKKTKKAGKRAANTASVSTVADTEPDRVMARAVADAFLAATATAAVCSLDDLRQPAALGRARSVDLVQTTLAAPPTSSADVPLLPAVPVLRVEAASAEIPEGGSSGTPDSGGRRARSDTLPSTFWAGTLGQRGPVPSVPSVLSDLMVASQPTSAAGSPAHSRWTSDNDEPAGQPGPAAEDSADGAGPSPLVAGGKPTSTPPPTGRQRHASHTERSAGKGRLVYVRPDETPAQALERVKRTNDLKLLGEYFGRRCVLASTSAWCRSHGCLTGDSVC